MVGGPGGKWPGRRPRQGPNPHERTGDYEGDATVELDHYSRLEIARFALLRAKSFRVGVNDCFPMPTPWPELLGAVERMLEHPYIGSANLEGVAETWVEGMSDSGFWLFCPEWTETNETFERL